MSALAEPTTTRGELVMVRGVGGFGVFDASVEKQGNRFLLLDWFWVLLN